MLCGIPAKHQRGEGRVLFSADDVERVKQNGEPRKKEKSRKRRLVLQKVRKSDMNSNRLRTLWGQWLLTGEFHHRLHLQFRAWNELLGIKFPQERVTGDNAIYHTTPYIRLTKWIPGLGQCGE